MKNIERIANMCLAPVVLAGYMMIIGTAWHPPGQTSSPAFEVQSCSKEVGAYGFASTNGLYAGGVQYGIQKTFAPLTVSVTPHAGVSYADHPVYNLPQRTQFDIGVGVYVAYDRAISGIKYSHWSNAGMEQPNIGIDMLILQTGFIF
jgi:hypothetical protein